MRPRDLSDHVPYEAGRGIEEVARELGRDPGEFVKLASNENPHGPSPAATVAIREAASTVGSYPKAAHADLREAVADRWGVADGQVWLANGADGAIDYLHRAALDPGERILVPDPGFAYYGMSARFHHGEVDSYPLNREDGFEQTADRLLESYDGQRVVYVTSPHNPTGTTMALEEIGRIAAGTDDRTLVVVDEAYGEFADRGSALELIEGPDAREDVAVLRTFSKAYGLAGVRLGYALVPEAWADAYTRVNTPFAASEVACRAGLAALDDDEHVERTVETVEKARGYVREHAEAGVWPSEGNFVLVDVGDASAVTAELQERGIIVRDCTSFGLPGCIRITCGTRTETERAVETLNAVLGDGIGEPGPGPAADRPEVSDA